MNERSEDFERLMVEKFGRPILRELLNEDMSLRGEKMKDGEAFRYEANVHIQLLDEKYKLGLDLNEQWSFDFPGWIGNLSFTGDHAKEIMVVGLEPHIKKHNYNIAYGLFEDSGCPKIDNSKEDFEIKLSDNAENERRSASRLLEVMVKLFASDHNESSMLKSRDHSSFMNELQKYYCTDLCHFAIKGLATNTSELPIWPAVKTKISAFIKREIDCIRPKLVVFQGIVDGKEFLDRFQTELKLIKKEPGSYKVKTKSVKVLFYQSDEYKVLIVPHTTPRWQRFWTEHLEALRKDIKARWPDIYS